MNTGGVTVSPAPHRARRHRFFTGRFFALFGPGPLVLLLMPSPGTAAVQGPVQAQPQGVVWTAATVLTAGGLLAACPANALVPVSAQSPSMRHSIEAAAALVSPVYLAVKAAVAGGGLVAGYWMLLLSFDTGQADAVLDAGRGGDWWLRAEHITCERPIVLIASPAGD